MARLATAAALLLTAVRAVDPSISASPLPAPASGMANLLLGVSAGSPTQFETDAFGIATTLRLGLARAFGIWTTGMVPNIDAILILSARDCDFGDSVAPCSDGVTVLDVQVSDARGIVSPYEIASAAPSVFAVNASTAAFGDFSAALAALLNVTVSSIGDATPTLVTSTPISVGSSDSTTSPHLRGAAFGAYFGAGGGVLIVGLLVYFIHSSLKTPATPAALLAAPAPPAPAAV